MNKREQRLKRNDRIRQANRDKLANPKPIRGNGGFVAMKPKQTGFVIRMIDKKHIVHGDILDGIKGK